MIIRSSRQYLFEKTTYSPDPKDPTGNTRVHHVSERCLVTPQPTTNVGVPDWVAEEDLFKLACKDGTIVRIATFDNDEVLDTMPTGIQNESKGFGDGVPTTVAQPVGNRPQTQKHVSQGGWGNTGLPNS